MLVKGLRTYEKGLRSSGKKLKRHQKHHLGDRLFEHRVKRKEKYLQMISSASSQRRKRSKSNKTHQSRTNTHGEYRDTGRSSRIENTSRLNSNSSTKNSSKLKEKIRASFSLQRKQLNDLNESEMLKKSSARSDVSKMENKAIKNKLKKVEAKLKELENKLEYKEFKKHSSRDIPSNREIQSTNFTSPQGAYLSPSGRAISPGSKAQRLNPQVVASFRALQTDEHFNRRFRSAVQTIPSLINDKGFGIGQNPEISHWAPTKHRSQAVNYIPGYYNQQNYFRHQNVPDRELLGQPHPLVYGPQTNQTIPMKTKIFNLRQSSELSEIKEPIKESYPGNLGSSQNESQARMNNSSLKKPENLKNSQKNSLIQQLNQFSLGPNEYSFSQANKGKIPFLSSIQGSVESKKEVGEDPKNSIQSKFKPKRVESKDLNANPSPAPSQIPSNLGVNEEELFELVKGVINILRHWRRCLPFLFSAVVDMQINPQMGIQTLDQFFRRLSSSSVEYKNHSGDFLDKHDLIGDHHNSLLSKVKQRKHSQALSDRLVKQGKVNLNFLISQNVFLVDSIQEMMEAQASQISAKILEIEKLKNSKTSESLVKSPTSDTKRPVSPIQVDIENQTLLRNQRLIESKIDKLKSQIFENNKNEQTELDLQNFAKDIEQNKEERKSPLSLLTGLQSMNILDQQPESDTLMTGREEKKFYLNFIKAKIKQSAKKSKKEENKIDSAQPDDQATTTRNRGGSDLKSPKFQASSPSIKEKNLKVEINSPRKPREISEDVIKELKDSSSPSRYSNRNLSDSLSEMGRDGKAIDSVEKMRMISEKLRRADEHLDEVFNSKRVKSGQLPF